MAGSYNHAVADDGQLLENEDFNQMVENLGDAYETVEEMYGMIWWLADWLAAGEGTSTARWVEEARKNYKRGLEVSPGVEGRIVADPR